MLYTFFHYLLMETVFKIDSHFISLGLQRVIWVGEEWYLSQKQEERNNF